MNQRPLKPSPLFLRLNSKKNSFLLTGLIFSCVLLFGDTNQVEINSLDPPSITYRFSYNDTQSLLGILDEGSSSRISIVVEVRRKNRSLLFRNPVVLKKTLRNTASRDLVDKEFRIEKEDGSEKYYTDKLDFINNFLSFHFQIPAKNFDSSDLSAYYMRIRGILIKRVYVEPFHIFQLFDYKNRISNNWTEYSLTQDQNAD